MFGDGDLVHVHFIGLLVAFACIVSPLTLAMNRQIMCRSASETTLAATLNSRARCKAPVSSGGRPTVLAHSLCEAALSGFRIWGGWAVSRACQWSRWNHHKWPDDQWPWQPALQCKEHSAQFTEQTDNRLEMKNNYVIHFRFNQTKESNCLLEPNIIFEFEYIYE
jgi:hypothetical protein